MLQQRRTASAQVIFVPAATVSVKFDGTRSTYAWPRPRSARAAWCSCRTPRPRSRNRPDPVGGGVGADVDGQLPLGAEHQIRGRPMSRDFTGSSICSRGIRWRAPISACPAPLPHVGQVHRGDAVRHLPRAPQVVALDARRGLARPFPGRSRRSRRSPARSAARAAPPRPGRRPRTGAPRSSRRRCPSSRGSAAAGSCPASGPRPCRAMLHPFTRGSSLASADTYLPACSHGSVRAKHGRSSASSSFRFRSASPAPILTAAAASDFVLVTQA